MPLITDDQETFKLPASTYGYSGAKLDTLSASEYTLVQGIFDESGSTSPFAKDMNKCMMEIVQACRHSPRADNLMLRQLNFGSRQREVHGFKLLAQCQPDDYQNVYQSGGGTALFDAAVNGIRATTAYAKQLHDSDYQVNAIFFVITDGEDLDSSLPMSAVKDALQEAVSSESLDSIVTILIGVNVTDQRIATYLERFKNDVGFTQYIELDKADKKTLAKLAQFLSKSITSQSQALAGGAPVTPQSLTF